MDTYFNSLPLELNILILSKSSSEDVKNLFDTLGLVYDPDILGRELSIKVFNVRPKFNYKWGDLFTVWYRVKKLGFNVNNIKSPIIDDRYDNILIRIGPDKYYNKLTLANSYGVLPSELLRFLYKENIYVRSPALNISVLFPLIILDEFYTADTILEERNIGVDINISDVIFDKATNHLLSLQDLESIPIRTSLVRSIHRIYSLDIEKYVISQHNLDVFNTDMLRTLIDLGYLHKILEYNTKLGLILIKNFDLDVPLGLVGTFWDSTDLILVLDFIFSGRYSHQLSIKSNKDFLLRNIYSKLDDSDGKYTLDEFKKIVAYANRLL